MKKGKAYVPFRFRLAPIKKMAFFHFHKSPDSEYEAFELDYIKGEPYGEGYRVVAWRTDGYRDSYLQDTLTIPENEEILSIGGKGLKEREEVAFENTYFKHEKGMFQAGFTFKDKLNRRIALTVEESLDKDTKPLFWLPSVGKHTENPQSLPLFFLYNFDFARKKDTELSFSIDGKEKQIDSFAFPKDFQTRHFVEFSTDTVICNFNEEGRYTLNEVDVNQDGIAKIDKQTLQYETEGELYRLEKITLEHESHPVEVTFSPAFPNHEEVMDGKPHYGELMINPEGDSGSLKGKYNVVYQQGKAVINLSFSEPWDASYGTQYERLIGSLTSNETKWYQSYSCTQIVNLENMDTTIQWERVNPERRTRL